MEQAGIRTNCLFTFFRPVSSLNMSEKIKIAECLQAYEVRPWYVPVSVQLRHY